MSNRERLEALRVCDVQYRLSLQRLNTTLLNAPEDERPPLREQRDLLEKKLEQTQIEIEFLTDRAALVQQYLRRRDNALENARHEGDARRREAIEARAAFYEVVVNEALTMTQTVFPIDEASLGPILADLNEAAREARHTVDSINRSIKLVNRGLDGLLLLVRAGARLAVL